jgi:hypothetical protein
MYTLTNRNTSAYADQYAYLRGRTAWEGFETATKAAAAGGVTTLVGKVSFAATTNLRYASEFAATNHYSREFDGQSQFCKASMLRGYGLLRRCNPGQ